MSPTSTVPATIASTVRSEEETIATHVAAVLAAAGGAIALVHPGFVIPEIVQAVVVPVSWLAAAGLEAYNLVTRRSLKKAIIGLLSAK